MDEAAPVGRMVDSSQSEDRKMIRLVRERPLLYARNNMPVASVYSRVKGLWREVAEEMGWSGTYYVHFQPYYDGHKEKHISSWLFTQHRTRSARRSYSADIAVIFAGQVRTSCC